VLAEVRRVLAPGGRLVVLDEVAVRGKDWRSQLARGVLSATAAGIAWPARERMEAAGLRVTAHAEPVGQNTAQVLVGVRARDPGP
jgi:ubiquinone/menaquinone biosynthesis C-methylase UbiE